MVNNRKNAFTLVELLAVIAVLGLILIIAIPKVMDTLNTQKKRTLELTTKSIIKAAEEKYLENSAYGINEEITCESVSNITNSDFESCKIYFDESGNASVTLIGKGRYDGINVCKGTKTSATAGKEECPLECTSYEMLIENAIATKPYVVKNASACSTYFTSFFKNIGFSNEEIDEVVSLCSSNTVDEISFNDLVTELLSGDFATELYLVKNNIIDGKIESSCKKVKGLQCTYDGDLIKGAEFTHNQYTYRYKEASVMGQIIDIEEDGWSVTLTDKESTSPVNTQVCSYINGKPLVSTMGMFMNSKATSIDVSSWETDNVISMGSMFLSVRKVSEIKGLDKLETSNVLDMSRMFALCRVSNLNLNNFDTSKVIDMGGMFSGTAVTTLDLSDFDTKNVIIMEAMFSESSVETLNLSSFDTRKVANMSYMFDMATGIRLLDLSSFDTSNVTNMGAMFSGTFITTGYARTQADADRLNASSNKPDTLTFVVKNNTN